MAYRFLIEEKKWKLMDDLFEMSSVLTTKEGIKNEDHDVSALIKNAYIHPCELTYSDLEYIIIKFRLQIKRKANTDIEITKHFTSTSNSLYSEV